MKISQNTGFALLSALLFVLMVMSMAAVAQNTMEGVAVEYARDQLAFYGPYGGVLFCLGGFIWYLMRIIKTQQQEIRDLNTYIKELHDKGDDRLVSNIENMQKLTQVIEWSLEKKTGA